MNHTEASGAGSVSIGENANGSIINTGTLILTLPRQTQTVFQYLSDPYRRAQKAGQPYEDFYDGVEANWVTIAHGLDAPRKRMEALLDFARDPRPRAIGLILGRAGEGKSTLLRRLAWELAEQGYPVFWYETYHHQDPVQGGAEALQRLQREYDRPLVFCFDDADQLDEVLPDFVRMLNAHNLRYRIFGAARLHQWQHARITLPLSPQNFELKAMESAEVEALLERMARHGGLGALAELPPRERLRRFQATMEHEELQLLPAMIAVRRRKRHFEQIIRDVLTRLERWEEGSRLLHAYAILAAVHRFGYWLESGLLAATMTALDYPMRVEQVRPLILDRLKGELLDIREGQERRLYTRHAIIAERVFRLLDSEGRLEVEGAEIYAVLFRELENHLVRHPRSQSRKLFTMLPLALQEAGEAELARDLLRQATELTPHDPVPFQVLALMEKEAGNLDEARRLFRQATDADPRNAPSWQAWALMEKEAGNLDEARRLFRKATDANPTDAPSWQAWALMEKEAGNLDEARRLFRKGVEADPTHAPLWQAWALMEQKEAGNLDEARRLFRKATDADPRNAPSWQAWALMEQKEGNLDEARRLFRKATDANPTDAPSWQAWALMEWRRGEGAEAALALCERALRHLRGGRDRAALLVVKARVLAALGRDGEAEAAFREALRLDGRNPHNHWHFARFLAARHRDDEANEHHCAILGLRRVPRWMRAKARHYCKRRR